jgi:hypothetical protein
MMMIRVRDGAEVVGAAAMKMRTMKTKKMMISRGKPV